MSIIMVLSPEYEKVAPEGMRPAERRAVDEPVVLTLVDNCKPNARAILNYIAAELERLLPIERVDVHAKGTSAAPIDEQTASDLATRSGLVIAGVGDCGGCSACSLQDAIQLERLGVPAVVVVTEPFVPMIAAFATSLGMSGYSSIVVLPHPVSSLRDDELREIAVRAAPDVARCLTTH